jgi:replicative DNA helicase
VSTAGASPATTSPVAHALSPDVELVRVLSARENYESFKPFVKEYTVLPEAQTIINDLGAYFAAHPSAKEVDWSTFLAWSRVTLHPSYKSDKWDAYRMIVDNIASDPTVNTAILERFAEMDYATQIRKHVDDALMKGGTDAMDKIVSVVAAYQTRGTGILVPEEPEPDLSSMLDSLVRGDGFEWRLEDMNRSIGPLHRGDLVLIGARPEVGKTTFLTSELTHMAAQLPEGKKAVIFNNEEVPNKIRVRLVQSALDSTVSDLCTDPAKAQKAYEKALAGRRIEVVHDTALSTADVERRLRGGDYGLIAFNILDKIVGFHKLEGVERLRALGVWARGLADKYGVVFALAQADSSAEGQRILNQNQLYGVKTGLQADSDVQIMIGKDNAPGFANRRWMNVVRNKLPGGRRTEPGLRHGVFEVEFDGEHGRYNTLAYRGTASK